MPGKSESSSQGPFKYKHSLFPKRGVAYFNCFASTDADNACLVGDYQVAAMERALEDAAGATPARSVVEGLAEQFT